MKITFYIACIWLFLINSSQVFSQKEIVFDGERKAFIYHVIWKNERLEDNFGKYFEYIGTPYLKRDGEKPKRDSVEWAIKNNPDNLLIRKNELAAVSKGMLMELCNKLALHDINLTIKHRNSEEPQHQKFIEEYETLVEILSNKLPPYAMKDKDGKKVPLLKMEKILAPTYSTKSKINVSSSGGAFDPTETKAIVKAVNQSIKLWVENRALQYFRVFGGRANLFDNQLMSAGDGSGFAGAGKEHKQDKWYKGLTHAIGFFYYLTDIILDGKSKKQKVKAMHVPIVNYKTYGSDTITNIHFDVWGKSQERQTTVVIQKGINSYILYGKDETNLLSPDSAYGKEGVTTYQMLIDELKDVHIAHYEEMIYGKRGYDYQIEFHKKERDICLEKIKVTEYKLNKIRYTPGSGNVINYKPKDPKNHQPNANESVKKKKRTTQDWLMYWYEKWEFHKEMIVKLQKEKEIALEILATLKDKLSEMEQNLGYRVLEYEEKDGIYMFEDSTIFNYETQDFKFLGTQYPEEFNIRVLSFDEKVLSTKADEVQIHWSLTDEDEDESLVYNRKFINDFKLNEGYNFTKVLDENDSIRIKELINFIVENPKKIKMNLSGNGKGRILSNGKYTKDLQPEYFKEYPQDSSQYSNQNATTFKIRMNQNLIFDIAGYTDGRIIHIRPEDAEGIKLTSPGNNVHPNEFLSGRRVQNFAYNFLHDINKIGKKFFPNGEAEEAYKILEKAFKKFKIQIGSKTMKLYMKKVKARL